MMFGDATVDQVQESVSEVLDKGHIVASHHGGGWDRKIVFHPTTHYFDVVNHGRAVLHTRVLAEAVDGYNRLLPR